MERSVPSLGDKQVLLQMRAGSINYRELLVVTGRYLGDTPANLVPLSDGSGEVVAVGGNVSRFKVGDRVCPTFFKTWISGEMNYIDSCFARGGNFDGVLAEYVACDESEVVHFPNYLSYEQAACLPCAGVTAWAALFGPRPVQPGQTVLTLGTGGVSTFAVQFAAAAGARVIATSSSNLKLEIARKLGASEVINYASHPDWDQEVRRLTNGRGVDHVIETIGGSTVAKSIASTGFGGQVHVVGAMDVGTINPRSMYQWKTIRGIYVGSRSHFEAMNRMLEFHKIVPLIDTVFDFEETKAAYEYVESAKHVGKVVIRIQ